ncbi:MAG TPA: arsenic resistance N-acetyltransferase ArsN2 [Cyclobacteriaceae bacterium]|nr:arsenic resistance N-acetyltransferase ArsN2 [Cyclobacteriaceae bacterium]HPW63947.1 arsenic resistance N-acetyltransferase ArsN2 [Cyclobacteriaceae bacterium]
MKEFIVQQQVKTDKELESLKKFLQVNQLPADDLQLKNSLLLTYYNADDTLVGSGGLEFYESKALLRSLAVSPELRGQQLGKQIVQDLLQQARETGMNEVYLLTQTAFFFFQKLGFTEVQRDLVPEEIKVSSEFSQVCPSTAQVMKQVL